MKPTPEIIDLARRFHELGGCEVNTLSRGRWYIDNATRYLELWNGKEVRVPEWMKKRRAENATIFILSESELWEWLNKRGYTFNQTSTLDEWRIIEWECGVGGRAEFYIAHTLESIATTNLHEALYRACVWVAERKSHEPS